MQPLSLLQEEVMDFEIKDLEIIDSEKPLQTQTTFTRNSTADAAQALSNSIIMNELQKETEELQNKLKLSYRRLLLFETENNKLIEEKNKFFFEVKNYQEKNQILNEKNEQLEKTLAEKTQKEKLLDEKVDSYEKINKTQLAEIRRFSKFHTKIQDVVKPFILQLKKQIAELKTELNQSQKINTNLTSAYKEFSKKMELNLEQKNNEILVLNAEKNGLIQTYEEQIHSFSKEILDLQAKNETAHKEIARLKKAVEFKNYFENEVIRFKRIHEEDQSTINTLSQKKSAAETQMLSLEQELSQSKTELVTLKSKLSDVEMNLEVTRSQFSKKIDELNLLTERFARLEKLNTQLSREMGSKQT